MDIDDMFGNFNPTGQTNSVSNDKESDKREVKNIKFDQNGNEQRKERSSEKKGSAKKRLADTSVEQLENETRSKKKKKRAKKESNEKNETELKSKVVDVSDESDSGKDFKIDNMSDFEDDQEEDDAME